MEGIFCRCSVRFFEDKPVEEDKLRKILEAAVRAPNAMGLEQWFFMVVKESSTVEKLWKIIKDAHVFYYEKARIKGLRKEQMEKLMRKFDERLYWAPVYVAVYLDERRKGLKEEFSDVEFLWGVESVAAAIENMMVAAASMGLGTCWVGVVNFVEDRVNELLNPPEGCRLIAVVPIGYPKGEMRPRPRRGLEEVCSFI